jgi:tryptophanyl-tRNA synthetase
VQHLELCRDIGDIFNRNFKSKLFPLPQHLLTPTKRVLSLRDPAQKMSKSHPEAASRILLTDSDGDIVNKIKRAVTDGEPMLSFDPEKRPGVSNLLSIMAGLQSMRGTPTDPQEIADMLNRDQGGKGSALKAAVSDTVIQSIRPIREELQRIKVDGGYLDQVEKIGREKARAKAAETMDRVRRIVGLAA